jgi:FkbM family methyltransferase
MKPVTSPPPRSTDDARKSTYRFFGQNGEDYLLWHFFDFKRSGFFLDIGAHDGVALSNTKSFEEQGWSGICVEPIPEMFAACQTVRRRVVNAACVSGPQKTVDLRVDRSGLFAGVETDEAHAARDYGTWAAGDPGFQTIAVPAMRASELILPTDPPIDFATIDVEGTEIDVLEGLDLRRHRPRVLVLEALTPEALETLDKYLEPFGYRRGRSVYWNHFYVETARDARKLRSFTINCRLTVPVIAGFGPVQMVSHAWNPPSTQTRLGFIVGKLRQRYRRWVWGV